MPVALLVSPSEPTASVFPESATAEPKRPFACALDALMYACCDHAVPARVKTYTAPEFGAPPTAPTGGSMPAPDVDSPYDATASVAPESATDQPNCAYALV